MTTAKTEVTNLMATMMSVHEVSTATGLPLQKIWKMSRRGQFPAGVSGIARGRMWPAQVVQDWVAARIAEGGK